MKRLNLELDDSDYAYLRSRATREDRTVAGLLRMAIGTLRLAEEFEPKDDPMWVVGSVEAPPDLSDRHDDYLYG